MDKQDDLLLDRYFNHQLTPEEVLEVEDRTSSDPVFGEAFALRQEMEAWPRRQEERRVFTRQLGLLGDHFFKEQMLGTDSEQPTDPEKNTFGKGGIFDELPTPPYPYSIPPSAGAHLDVRINWNKWMMAAASVAVLIVAAVLAQPTPTLYQRYAQHEPLHWTERNMNKFFRVAEDAELSFNAGKYERALGGLDSLLIFQPDNAVALLYRGVCLLELERPEEARASLEPVVKGRTVFHAHAVWYTALAFLQEKKMDRCRLTLLQINPSDPFYQEAQKLMLEKELRPPK